MIQATNLSKKFGHHDALQGLSFSVPEGSAHALIGANGAGALDGVGFQQDRLVFELCCKRVDQFDTFNSIGSEYCKNRIDSMS
jgi:hypothetical protein